MIEKGWKLDASFCFGKCILSVCQWKSYTVWAFLGAPNGSRPWAGHILHHCVYDQWQNTPACPVFNDSLTAQFNLKIWPRQSPQACNAYYVSIAYDLYARHFQPRAFPPGKPRALDARWFLWAGHLAVNSVPLKQQQKTRFVTSCRHFWRRSESRVSNSQALSFWSRWRAFIDNKTTFFVFFQLEWLISWPILCSSIELKQLCLLWMATNNFVYRSAGLRGRAFDRHSRNRGRHLPTKTARRAGHVTSFFNCPWYARGFPRGEGVCGWSWRAHYVPTLIATHGSTQPIISSTVTYRQTFKQNLWYGQNQRTKEIENKNL